MAEITVIESFLPRQLTDAELEAAIDEVIARTGASSVRDIGKVMGALKAGYSGRIDFSKADVLIKGKLA